VLNLFIKDFGNKKKAGEIGEVVQRVGIDFL